MAGEQILTAFLILICTVANVHRINGQQDGACSSGYVYVMQPPQEIVCNAYTGGVLMLDCAITGPGDIEIQWYFSRASMNEDPVLLVSGSKYNLTTMTVVNGVGLGLTVYDLNEDEDTGMYWCRACISHGDSSYLLSASQSFTLHDEIFYSFINIDCPENTFIRNGVTRCATIARPKVPLPIMSSRAGSYSSLLLVQSTSVQLPSMSLTSQPPMMTMMPAPSNPTPSEIFPTDTISPTPSSSGLAVSTAIVTIVTVVLTSQCCLMNMKV